MANNQDNNLSEQSQKSSLILGNALFKYTSKDEADAQERGGEFYNAIGNVSHGQLGLGPNILNIDGVTPMVQNKATAILISGPQMWRSLPILTQYFRNLVEVHAKSISGVSVEYTLDKQESPIGQDSQNLSMPSRTSRAAITPSFTWQEVTGNGIFRFHQRWLNDINHADTHVSSIGDILASEKLAWVYSTISASMLFIQQDPTGLSDRIIDAVVVTNMFPQSSGTLEFKVEPNTSEVPDRSINYTGVLAHNENTRELGRLVLDALQIHRPNYNRAPAGKWVDIYPQVNTSNPSNSSMLDGLGKQVYESIRDFKLVDTSTVR